MRHLLVLRHELAPTTEELEQFLYDSEIQRYGGRPRLLKIHANPTAVMPWLYVVVDVPERKPIPGTCELVLVSYTRSGLIWNDPEHLAHYEHVCRWLAEVGGRYEKVLHSAAASVVGFRFDEEIAKSLYLEPQRYLYAAASPLAVVR